MDKKTRKDFPIFKKYPTLIYFDSGASAQKPSCVIDYIQDYYSNHYGTVHRSIYTLAMNSTNLYNDSRKKVKEFMNAKSEEEIVFTRGTTDSINIVARSLGIDYIKEGDEIISTEMEHHSNLVPYQMLSKEKKAVLKIIPINEKAELDLEAYKKLLSSKTKLVCIGHMSNSTGTINPIKKIIELAHEKKALVLIDGSQAAPHLKLDMQDLDADFYVFSGHKTYGPTGVGVLYGKKALLEMMPPIAGGGDMIEEVELYSSTYQKPPLKFEAGTPPFAQVIALKKALDYIDGLGKENILAHESKLLHYATEKMLKVPGLKIIGTAKEKGPIISFLVEKAHPFDIGTLLDTKNIAIRTGHHCAQPTMRKFKIPGTARVSFGVYNSLDEIDRFVEALKKVIQEIRK